MKQKSLLEQNYICSFLWVVFIIVSVAVIFQLGEVEIPFTLLLVAYGLCQVTFDINVDKWVNE